MTIERPERRNAVDLLTARALFDAFKRFDADPTADVAVLTGAGGASAPGPISRRLPTARRDRSTADGELGPMGPTRLTLGKPVIAAIEGPAVAGGMELALWCDLRIAARSAIFGVFNRRFGVPLVDLGTIRLPRIVGHGRALELILTGRAVDAEEALRIGLVNELTEDGQALTRALALARTLSGFPQTAMRNDRISAIEQWDLSGPAAVANEVAWGLKTLASGEASAGSARFKAAPAGTAVRSAETASCGARVNSPRRPALAERPATQRECGSEHAWTSFGCSGGLKPMSSDPGDPDDEAAPLRARLDRLSGELKGRAAAAVRSRAKAGA